MIDGMNGVNVESLALVALPEAEQKLIHQVGQRVRQGVNGWDALREAFDGTDEDLAVVQETVMAEARRQFQIREHPTSEREAETENFPPLPESCRLDAELATGASPWLDEYIQFSRKWSPRSYEGFHEACGLWVLSTVAARRVAADFGKTRFTNLYFMLAGRTTVHAKSSAAEIATQVIRDSGLSYLLAADEATPQSFLRDLSTQLPADYDSLSTDRQELERLRLGFAGQRGWFYEEFGSGLASMSRSDGVMADFRGILRKFDDCPPDLERSTIKRGRDHVERPYLALLANLTPADLRPLAKQGGAMWSDGFFARFAFVTPPPDEVLFGRFPPGKRIIPASLLTPVAAWHERLGIPQVSIVEKKADGKSSAQKTLQVSPVVATKLALPEQVYKAYYNYHDGMTSIVRSSNHPDLDGCYGRLAEKALRVALLLASQAGCSEIILCHWARAQEIMERWRMSLHRLYDQVTEFPSSERATKADKVLSAVEKLGNPTAREIAQSIRGMKSPEAAQHAEELVGNHLIVSEKVGRTTRYHLP